MAKDHELSGLMKFSERDGWADLFDEVLDEHFGAVLTVYDLDMEKLAEMIGDENMTNLWGCAFEDFLTQPLSPEDPRTITQEYLKRRGWKETVSTRRYIEALGNSVFSLYEVGDVVPGQSMVLRDLLRDSEPVTVIEHTASRTLRNGERLGCRVVPDAGRFRIAGGLATFDERAAARVMKDVGEGMTHMRTLVERSVAEDQEPGVDETAESLDEAVLRSMASHFTSIWIDSALEGRLPKVPPPQFNSDGDDLRFHTISYGFTVGVSPDAVADRLDAMPDLCPEDDGAWNWVDRSDDDAPETPDLCESRSQVRDGRLHVELEDGTPVLATLELFEDGLIVLANSKPRADRAKVMIKSVLRGMVGQPQTHVGETEGDPAGG
jgi:hypothetical protein